MEPTKRHYNAIVMKDPKQIKPYWSNCIIEAIRAKLKDPAIRLIMIWPWQNDVWCPHIMWTDGHFEYDFHAHDVPMLGWVWHRGKIRTKPMGWARSYINGIKSLRIKRRTRRDRR